MWTSLNRNAALLETTLNHRLHRSCCSRSTRSPYPLAFTPAGSVQPSLTHSLSPLPRTFSSPHTHTYTHIPCPPLFSKENQCKRVNSTVCRAPKQYETTNKTYKSIVLRKSIFTIATSLLCCHLHYTVNDHVSVSYFTQLYKRFR